VSSFDLDLGLERYDEDELSNLYLTGGVKLEADGKVITSFNYNDDGYLGTYIIIIWKNIARNVARFSERDEIKFEIMTEGWDPEYKVEKVENRKVRISMTDDSVTWSDDIEVPRYCQNGVEIDLNDFLGSVIESGEALRKFCQKIDSSRCSGISSNVVELLEDVKGIKVDYENEDA
jgi:hypothetical protein